MAHERRVMGVAPKVELTPEQTNRLEQWVSGPPNYAGKAGRQHLLEHLNHAAAVRLSDSDALRIRRTIDDATPAGPELYLIADNYAAHKHPKVQNMVAPPPSFPRAVHADQFVLAEYGRAILPRFHNEPPSTQCLS